MAQSAYDASYLQPDGERRAIKTLFVSGLPDDVKAREIHNLFRRRPGFHFCQLEYTGRGNEVVAFATFTNHQATVTSMQALNGVIFDPQTGATLHVELARSNSRRKWKSDWGPYVVIDKRIKESAVAQAVLTDGGISDANEAHGTDSLCTDKNDDVAAAKSETIANSENTGANTTSTIDVGPQPCSTLFIANLGPNCTEDELKQVLSNYPGFNVLKVRTRGGMPVAFADFEEVEQATKVLQDLQGSLLPSSDRGGMHIEYARSKMRKH